MALGMEVNFSPGNFVLDGDLAPVPKMGVEPPPQFLANFNCAQTAGCITMPLGVEVGLSLGDFVLDGDPASPPLKGHSPPIFGQCPLWPNDWLDYHGTWYGGRPRLRRL